MSSLNKKNIEDVYGLTPMQEGMLFHYLMAPRSDRYFEQLCLSVRGEIKTEAFTCAWQEVTGQNEVLRSLFRWEKVDKPVQVVLKEHCPQIRTIDLSAVPEHEKEKTLEQILQDDRNETFDLKAVPFRITWCTHSEEDHEIIISNHHILYDGWSGGIILKEFFDAYRRITFNEVRPDCVKRPFKEYVRWLNSRNGSDRQQYWANYLKGVDGLVELSVKQNLVPQSVHEPAAGKYDVRFDTAFKEKLEEFARRHKVTLAALFYSAWGLLLQRYNNSEDVIFGITVSGRSAPLKGIKDIAGLFINTLPLRVNVAAGHTLTQLVDRVHRDLQNQEPYEDTALVDIKQFSGFENDREMFDTVVVVENYPLDIASLSHASGAPLHVKRYSMNEMTHYDLTMVLSLFEDIEVVFSFDTHRFPLHTIKQLSNHFTLILTHIVYSPEDTLKQVNLLSEDEKDKILGFFNDTSFAYPHDRTIHGLFLDQVKRTPDRIALIHDSEGAISYNQLHRQVKRVVQRLKESGLRPGDITGLKLSRSIDLVAGILGALGARTVCLPLNPELPRERIQYMMNDSHAAILLTHDNLYAQSAYEEDIEQPRPDSMEPAYVIYTSGSTGKPKGVLLHHLGIINHAFTKQELLHIQSNDILCFSLSSGFVASLWLMFSPLFTGSPLVLYPNSVISDSFELMRRVQRDHVAVLEVVPSLLHAYFRLLEEGESPVALQNLRAMVLTGEEILPQLVRSLYRIYPHIHIYNAYGQSECSDDTLHYPCPPPAFDDKLETSIPLGKPSHNTCVYVLDQLLRLQPIGLAGELYITGHGLAYGYLNSPELTVSRFIHAHFQLPDSAAPQHSSLTIYRTGDLAKWLPDGNIAFLGRLDQQVKVRGHRIELGGIEKQLLTHPMVKEAVVIVRNDNDRYLCAYYVAGETRCHDKEDPAILLRHYLEQHMPGYMIPSYIIELSEMPLNTNGKIDRRALPAPAFKRKSSYIPPRNPIEEQMAAIWLDVLGLPRGASLGIDDNFFENGGHSLKATHLSARIYKAFGSRIPLEKIFAAPTIGQLSQFILPNENDSYETVPAVEERHYYPLSSAQKRLYFLQQMDAQNAGTTYNITSLLQLHGRLEPGRIENTLKRLIQRHESLRTSFHMVNDQPVQVIHPRVKFGLETMSTAQSVQQFIHPFELSQVPLFRAGLLLSGDTATMVVDMHHIISDGASAAVLVKEFTALYSNKTLPPLSVRYRDFTLWQTASHQQDLLHSQREFWLDVFRTPAPVIDLPIDYSRPADQCFEGGKYDFSIPEQQLNHCLDLARTNETTLFAVLLAAFSLLMNKLTGQQDIVIGTGVEGRPHAALGNVVGMFVNTLALRTCPETEKSFSVFLREIKHHTLRAFDNTQYPFEDLVEQLDVQRDTSRNPLFDVCLQLDNIDFPQFSVPGLTIAPQPFDPGISKFDLTLWVTETQGQLQCSFEYASALFKVETAACLAGYFKEILSKLSQPGAPELSLEVLHLPSKNRKRDLIRHLNDSLELDILAFNQAHPQPVIQHYLERAFEKYALLTAVQNVPLNDSSVPGTASSLSYRELDRRSSAVAAGLKQRGIAPGTLVGVLSEDRMDLIIAMTGIMRAACVFVPLDKSLPSARLDTMIQTTGLEHILTVVEEPGIPHDFSPLHYSPEDKLYIYFTSGSTGTPKAIIGKNKSTLHFVQWQINTFQIEEKSRFSQLTTPGFDAFLRDTLVPLCSGGTICIPPSIETLTQPGVLAQWLEDAAIHYVHCVPSLFRLFNTPDAQSIHFNHLKAVFMSGERLNPADVQPWYDRFGRRIKIVNFYGPTETTMIKTSFTVNPSSLDRPRIPIGQAMPGSQVIVMDRYMNILDQLMPGELVIRTPFAAHGYFDEAHSPGQACFLPDPFGSNPGGIVLYKTGDQGRVLLDGTIDLLGRIDRQVKIRGMRVELGEIEAALLSHSNVREAAVITKDTPSGAVLIAYIASDKAENETNGLETALLHFLASLLPSYMVPANILFLSQIPKKPNGKVDYQHLPEDIATEDVPEEAVPAGSIEARLTVLWNGILQNNSITLNQSFFEAGGNSLHLMTLIMKIQKEFDLRLSLADIFNNLTIAKQAAFIRQNADIREETASTIPVATEQQYYPLSPAQNRLFILHRLEPSNTGYNMTAAFHVEGELNLEILEHTFLRLIHRHSSLRTSFHIQDGTPVQTVHPDAAFSIGSIRPMGPVHSLVKPFDLSRAPLFRAGVYADGESTVLFIDIHHIICDGYSIAVLVNDFMSLYDNRELPTLHIAYKDYAVWFNRHISSQLHDRQAYWLEQFNGDLPVLELPLDFPRPALRDMAGKQYIFQIDSSLTQSLQDFSNRQGLSLYMTLLTAYVFLLYRLGGNNKDLIIGTPTAGRRLEELQSLVGMFVNTLPLRFNLPTGQSFAAILQHVKQSVVGAMENQDYPFEKLVDTLALDRDPARNPLFDVMFVFQNIETPQLRIPGLELKPLPIENNVSRFDLTLNIVQQDQELECILEYSTRLFRQETIVRFAQYYCQILSSIPDRSEQPLHQIQLMSTEEKNLILQHFSGAAQTRDYPLDVTLDHMFRQQAARTPDHIAAVDTIKSGSSNRVNKSYWTYRELNQRSNQLANQLKSQGVCSGSIAAIKLERSVQLIIGLLAILKARAAYLPVDPSLPPERVEYMLKDSHSTILLEPGDDTEFPCIQVMRNVESPLERGAPKGWGVSSWQPAYIIYTSGTTGRPKGVLVHHRGVVNLVHARWEVTKDMPADRVSQVASPSFDAMASEIWPCILRGSALYIAPEPAVKDPVSMKQWLIEESITLTFQPTPVAERLLLMQWLPVRTGLRIMMTAGDRLTRYPPARLPFELYNLYGPTEDSVWSTYAPIEPVAENHDSLAPHIGKPVPNHYVYILSPEGEIQPIGVPGELCISGTGTARGYLNKPELTAERFVIQHNVQYNHSNNILTSPASNPSRSDRSDSQKMDTNTSTLLYKTGDLVCWLPDGNIRFLGRIDRQVKLRGYRIELAEIEVRLMSHPLIKESTLTLREDQTGDKHLCSYVVFHDSGSVPVTEIKEYLSCALPQYMVPSFVMELPELPLTASGKLNHAALPQPDITHAGHYTPPRSDIESRLVSLWKETLGLELDSQIGIDDNFFQIGGHSLNAVTLIAEVQQQFGERISLLDFFSFSTIREMAGILGDTIDASVLPVILPCETREYYPLSHQQERMYILHQMDPRSTVYNIPAVVRIHGSLDLEKLQSVFQQLIHRHDSLRTAFHDIHGQPVQIVYPPSAIQFSIQTTNPQELISTLVQPFQLTKAPLIRVVLAAGPGDTLLGLDVHHIISDGLSLALLVNEFTALYSGQKLQPLTLQYRDYALWQRRGKGREDLAKQHTFWLERFQSIPPALQLPTDFPRPNQMEFAGNRIHFSVDANITASLHRWARQHDATLYMVILTACYIWLQYLSGQDDIAIGTPTAGRRYPGLKDITGMFVNTLALHLSLDSEQSPQSLLQAVKTHSLEAFENQDYPFEELVEQLANRIPRDMSRNPLFDVMLVMQNFMSPQTALTDLDIQGLKVTPWEGYYFDVSKFDVTLIVEEIGHELQCTLEYRTRLFHHETISRFAGYYRQILSALPGHSGKPVHEIQIMSAEEKHRILQIYSGVSVTPDYPLDVTLDYMFQQQAARTPGRIAVVDSSPSNTSHTFYWSYRELDQRSNELARQLRSQGVIPGSIVAVKLNRSTQLVVSLLAILKARAAYLPIDPSLPEDRIDYMLKDSHSSILLKSGTEVEYPCLQVMPEAKSPLERGAPEGWGVSPSQPAYIIYTSGTTGRPKGVLVHHRGVVNLVHARWEITVDLPSDRMSQVASPSFDAMGFEIWPCILRGAALYIAPELAVKDPARMNRWLIEASITLTFQPTPVAERLLHMQWPAVSTGLRIMMTAGDRLTRFPPARLPFKLYNLYGPTEDSVWTTYAPVEPRTGEEDSFAPPIGKPVPNHRVYILGPHHRLQPVGVPGELCVSGAGTALGYLNNPELTAARFVTLKINGNYHHNEPHTLSRSADLPPEIIYRTGDQVRWLPDGSIQFIGRIDRQVKIRGFRIELAEIEVRLSSHSGIKESTLTLREDPSGDKYLCAYVVYHEAGSVPVAEIKEYLSRFLPQYMVPAFVVELPELPLTASGKLNHAALPEPQDSGVPRKTFAPRDILEIRLLELWQQVLMNQSLDIHSDFFQAGGHSLKATLLLSRIHKQFQVKVPLVQLFRSPTVRDMADYLRSAAKQEYIPIPAARPREYYPLSSAQSQLYIVNQMKSGAIHYNLPHAFKLDGILDLDRLTTVFYRLIQRHESLRTSFRTVAGEPFQVIHESVPFTIAQLGPLAHVGSIKNLVRPFDLSIAPLFRVELIQLEEDSHILFVDMHHIITDGTSIGILIAEFSALYDDRTLDDLRLQYKDYAIWQQEWMTSPQRDRQQAFWLERLEFPLPRLSLPLDRPHGEELSYEGRQVAFQLDESKTSALNRLAVEHSTTVYNILLSIYYVLLFKLSGQEDIIVAAPVANRAHPDVHSLIGMFVNTLPLRNFPARQKTFSAFLSEVSQRTLDAHENQEFPFDTLADLLMGGESRETSRNPIFDVLFLLQNMEIQDLKINQLTLNFYDMDFNASPFDLILLADEAAGSLRFKFLYKSALFDPETVERFSRYYTAVISAVTADPTIRLQDIQLIRLEKSKALILEDADGDFGF